MDISKLGEFGLIDHLTKDIKLKNASSVYGVGDDCAVMHYPDKEVLVTSDMLMEGVHFDLTYITLQQLGYKAAMENISDVFAMNGLPRQMIVSIAVGKRFKVEDLEEFYNGLRKACGKWDVDIVGGDTTSSYTGLAISITCIGEAMAEDIVYVKHLQEEGMKINDFQPDFAGREYLIQRQLKPEARGDIIALLKENNIRPTAMMDISDGLSSELLHICHQSHCGCRIYEKKIPIDYQTAVTAEEFNMNVTTCAMNGGEDYELLFTCPIGDHEKLNALEPKGIRQIGYITKEELGTRLLARDNKEFDITAQGWKAF